MLHELFPAFFFFTLTVGILILIVALYCNEVNFLNEMKMSIDAIPASLIFYVIIFDYLITARRV